QSRQAQSGVGRNRIHHPCRRRNVQDDGRPRSPSRALSRRTGVSRTSRRRCAAGLFRSAALVDRICQGRPAPRPGGHDRDALADAAGRSGSQRETLPGYEASFGSGIGAPKRTPEEIVERLNKEVNVSVAEPKLNARLADLGGTVLGGSPADFGKLISDETMKWGKVILAANIKP